MIGGTIERITGIVCGALFMSVVAAAQAAEPPNIVLILVDDLGWKDLACYGHPWHDTPNIDRLASEGMRFTQAYAAAPICSASRASLLTGKSPARLGFEFVTKNEAGRQTIEPSPPLRAPPYTLDLSLEERTLAEVLGDGGYDTAFFGKWHLSQHYERYLGWSPTHGPAQQGFATAEEDFGNHPYNKERTAESGDAGVFHSDGVTERAVRYLKGDRGRPFLLMVSHFYVHTPVKSNHRWLREKYDAKLPQGIPNRNARVEYGAFVETMDHYVGEVLDALDDTGQADQTLVLFVSDNGGHPEFASNGPLRGSKWNLYEGGLRVPMIARWPGHIAGDTTCDAPVIGWDLLPTFAEAGGADLSDAESLDGQSIVPLFGNPAGSFERPLYFHFPYYHPEGGNYGEAIDDIGVDDFAVSKTHPHAAIRQGTHKLLYFYEDHRTELYDLAADPGEARDRSDDDPELAKSMGDALRGYLEAVHARMPTEEKSE